MLRISDQRALISKCDILINSTHKSQGASLKREKRSIQGMEKNGMKCCLQNTAWLLYFELTVVVVTCR